MITLTIGGCSQPQSTKIEGAWKLVYVIGIDGNKPYYSFSGTDTTEGQIRIWSKDHFSFAGILKYDTLHSDSFGGGTYKLDGNKYEENYMYNNYVVQIGKKFKSLLEIRNDTLFIINSIDDNWNLPERYTIEKYVKMK